MPAHVCGSGHGADRVIGAPCSPVGKCKARCPVEFQDRFMNARKALCNGNISRYSVTVNKTGEFKL